MCNTLRTGYLMYYGYYNHTLNISSDRSLVSQEFSKQSALWLALLSKTEEDPRQIGASVPAQWQTATAWQCKSQNRNSSFVKGLWRPLVQPSGEHRALDEMTQDPDKPGLQGDSTTPQCNPSVVSCSNSEECFSYIQTIVSEASHSHSHLPHHGAPSSRVHPHFLCN